MRVLRRPSARSDQPVALTIGNFDGVHRGHQAMLARLVTVARERNLVATAMTFEPQPQEFFALEQAPPRLTSMREKLELMSAAGVDQVLVCRFDHRTAQMRGTDFIERIVHQLFGISWLLVGDDFRFGAQRSGDFGLLRSQAEKWGYEVEAMGSVTFEGLRVSSTAVRGSLERGDLESAAQLLGRPYSICGRVERGDALGTEFGYPTANVKLNRHKAPLAGIFVVEVEGLGTAALPGVASMGVRPTVTSRGQEKLEVHLFDFDRDIYGRQINVRFLRKLRDEVKFAGVDELIRQMDSDAREARAHFSRE